MATHRLVQPCPSLLSLLTPKRIRRLSLTRRVELAVDASLFGLLFGAYFLIVAGAWAMGGWLIGALLWLVTRTIVLGRQQQDDDALAARNQDLMEHLAREPGGAPLMADITSHCGCALRYAYDADQVAWIPVRELDIADSCLANAR